MFDALTPWHLALILLAFVLLFGYKKLPDATRSLGRSLRIFKTEVAAMKDDDQPAPPVAALAAPTADELDEQARAEEARAAALRARLAAGPAA